MITSFYNEEEIVKLGLKKYGKNVLISRKASFYSPELIQLGSNVRIDDFCILSGNISIGSYVHISAYTALYGKFGICIEDFVTISGRVLVYSQTDDYSGEVMTNPMVNPNLTRVTGGPVVFKKHSIIAAGCIIFPEVTIGEGAAIGAMSLVNKNLEPWSIYVGIPAKYLKPRSKKIIELENLI
ncbi:MAG: acyltransferase [Candidatus Marinimicrobia bacterium]|jgi:galactoside O-acetyltransferase|nr:acyltransferase [Candidatus Neomarinimicrobiota bacterium]